MGIKVEIACPKCKIYNLQEDKSPSSPSGTLSCSCGHVQYKKFIPMEKEKPGPQTRRDNQNLIYSMMKRGYTRDHILESFPDLTKAAISKHMTMARKRLKTVPGYGLKRRIHNK